MQLARDPESLALSVAAMKDRGTVALVPTMGALHDGHLALVAEAKRRADFCVASIFVNPTQFNDKADLDAYPRTEEDDAKKLEAAGCDLLWLPTPAQLYPDGFATSVSVGQISERWEGAHRPGHFDGVATIVTKLFTNVRPHVAIFGEKDFQQLALIRRLNADLDLGAQIVGLPTVREQSGLAMSSRNARLSAADRETAAQLKAALDTAAAAITAGEQVPHSLEVATKKLELAGFGPIDYVAYVDADTLEPRDVYTSNGRLIAAATLEGVRLIDNIPVE